MKFDTIKRREQVSNDSGNSPINTLQGSNNVNDQKNEAFYRKQILDVIGEDVWKISALTDKLIESEIFVAESLSNMWSKVEWKLKKI